MRTLLSTVATAFICIICLVFQCCRDAMILTTAAAKMLVCVGWRFMGYQAS